MKRSREVQLHTPIKKWQQMSPMEDELAIFESDISSQEQIELFTSLVGTSPLQHTPHISNHHIEEESPEPFSSSPSSLNESIEEESPNTVISRTLEEFHSEQRIPLKPLQQNRKGCNCRNSKCQKNYCDCLKMGLICEVGVCSCEDCHNKQEKQIHREINQKLELQEPLMKGCRCKKSRCLKKYCECHSGGKKCGPLCQCIQCYNRDQNIPPLMTESMLSRLRRPFLKS